MRAMQKTRRSWALAVGALLLAAPLSSCGFDNATERVYTPAAGTNNRDATVDVLGAVIVSAEEGSGTFVATFVNNDQEEDGVVEAITPEDEAIQFDFSPVTVPPGGMVNLAAEGEEGVPVEGEISAGGVVPVTVQVSGGEVLEMTVPVVPNCNEFAGIDGTGGDCEVAEPEGEH
jgi:hypothetical protein